MLGPLLTVWAGVAAAVSNVAAGAGAGPIGGRRIRGGGCGGCGCGCTDARDPPLLVGAADRPARRPLLLLVCRMSTREAAQADRWRVGSGASPSGLGEGWRPRAAARRRRLRR